MPIRLSTLMLVLLAGCVSREPSRAPNPTANWQSQKLDAGPDRVLFDVAVLQRPIGDSFLTDEIWESADEMIVPPELRELLDLNGLRVGLLVGSPPEKLLGYLKSERDCLERRGRSTAVDAIVEQKLFEHDEPIDVIVCNGKDEEPVALDRPRFGLDLMPSLKERDVVRLKLTPRFEAGDKAVNFKPVPSESKWAMEVKRPTRALTHLTVDVDLAPDQLLVVGPRLDREQSIGYHSFVGRREGAIQQRLVVLRHLRSKTPAVAEAIDSSFSVNPPLAVQAATSRR